MLVSYEVSIQHVPKPWLLFNAHAFDARSPFGLAICNTISFVHYTGLNSPTGETSSSQVLHAVPHFPLLIVLMLSFADRKKQKFVHSRFYRCR
jgi:hypothetical protein